MTELYIGLMSGTSADGIDAALVNFSNGAPNLVATHYVPHAESLRTKILALCQMGSNEVERLGELDHLLGKAFATAANELLASQSLPQSAIQAVGSHGQTIRHRPTLAAPFTLQIGDPNIIAAETGITTIADFRRKDIALGGEGAPLVPAFHQAVFSSDKTNRAIVNIGGIANVTLLHAQSNKPLLGFDTGPGNVLMDTWIQTHQQKKRDEAGAWGATGKMQPALLERFLSDPFFAAEPPKSTGREHFNLDWIQHHLAGSSDHSPVDVQATLAELTAASILNAIKNHMQNGDILICGGGAHNAFLMSRLQSLCAPAFKMYSTDDFGIHPDWVEAIAFAWLARQTLHKLPGNLPNVTGAKREAVLGGVYFA